MPFPRPALEHCRPVVAAIALMVAGLFAPAPAAGQVAVLVNGDPITNYEIEQRSRLTMLSTRKPASRQETIEALIEDRLKVQIGKRFGLVLTDADINSSFAGIAKTSRATPEQFAKQLESQGLNPNTLKAKMRADLTWNQVIRGKFAGAFQFGEKDIMKMLESRNVQDIGHEYLLRPIVFVVPRGSPPNVAEGRKREVDALRARFQDCDAGIALARSLRDVAVRDPIRRNSADLSPQLREVLARIEVGRLTPPEVTPGGVEVFAVCDKKETSADTPGKRQVREEMFNEKFNAQGARYLKELRSGAMIEYR